MQGLIDDERTVKITRTKLLGKLRRNREERKTIYDEAIVGWRKKCVTVPAAALNETRVAEASGFLGSTQEYSGTSRLRNRST